MRRAWLRKQAGQAVILVAIAVLVLAGILMLALDGGGIYLDKRQIQNAADAAALTGAESLQAIPFSYSTLHTNAVSNLIQNLAGTSIAGTGCSPSCPNSSHIGMPGVPGGIGTIALGAGYYAELNANTSYTYQVTVWHVHQVAIAALHGFQSTITISARATAQNADLPYAIVLLQDTTQYQTYSNFNINGSPGSVTLQYSGGSNPNNRGGIFSNASIAPGNDSPSIIFSPGNGQGSLWAVHESAADLAAMPGKVSGANPSSPMPGTGTHLDFPNYPEPAPPSTVYNGATAVTGATTVLCPGQYSNQVIIQNGATAILYPGVYQVQANGVSVQGTLRTLQPGDFGSGPISCAGLPTLSSMPADPGAIIEVRPGNMSGSTLCNKHIFSAAATSTITLQPSPKYYNISIYIETMSGWQTACTSQPLGTNVLKFSGGSCYSIQGAIYAPADNITLTGSSCGSGVGQIVAWTMTINGNGNVNEIYNPNYLPYMKGLTQ